MTSEVPKNFHEIINTNESFRTFETLIGCSSLLLNAFNDSGDFHTLICAIEDCMKRSLTDNELHRLVIKCNSYSIFYKFQFPGVIIDIKQNEEKPESKEDCWILLNEYLGREPSTHEVNIFWDHVVSLDDHDSSDAEWPWKG